MTRPGVDEDSQSMPLLRACLDCLLCCTDRLRRRTIAYCCHCSGTILGRTLEAEQSLEQLENDIWSRLPLGCHVAWENLLARHSEGSEVPSSPAEGSPGVGAEGGSKVARILDDFADTGAKSQQLSCLGWRWHVRWHVRKTMCRCFPMTL